MKLLPLEQVKGQVKLALPLPFGIRDASGQLLLARGQVVADLDALEVLMERGALVDAEEAGVKADDERLKPPSETFPGRWEQLQLRATGTLRVPPPPDLVERVRDMAVHLIDMGGREPDLLLYLALRAARDPTVGYGIVHALHVAAVCGLIARRLGWSSERQLSMVSAAITMNISMATMQTKLATMVSAPTAAQKDEINKHPLASAQILRQCGVQDAEWLACVEQHHERTGGSGYPTGMAEPNEMSQILRFVDVYTARVSKRESGGSLTPAEAARDLFTRTKGHAHALVLVKELGIYPPGIFVKLASGETAVVLRRGQQAQTPTVACLTSRQGDPLPRPLRRENVNGIHAVASIVPDREVRVRFTPNQLY